MYRLKVLTDDEWSQFRAKFMAVAQIVLSSNGRIAVFVEARPVGGLRAILIPEYKSSLIEAFAPGGWKNCYSAMDRRWTLLAGTSAAFAELGVTECLNSYMRERTPADLIDNLLYTPAGCSPREEYRVN